MVMYTMSYSHEGGTGHVTEQLRKLLAAGKSSREGPGELGIPWLRRDFLVAMRRAGGEGRGA
jgi:hypothetical protein